MGVIKENTVGSNVNLEASGSSANLTNGSAVQLATADYDNTSSLGLTHTFRLTTNSFGATAAAGTTLDLILVPAFDGTNFGTVDASTPYFAPGTVKASFVVVKGTGTEYLDVEGLALGPYKYRGYLRNNTGQTLSAGWAVDGKPETEQY